MKGKKYSIGNIAKLYNITTQTLRFYDDIGLFKPLHINPETSYRYYSSEQFNKLETIIFLKNLDVSLEDIKKYFENEKDITLLNFFEEKIQDIEEKILDLEKSKKRILGKIESLKRENELNKFCINYFPKRYLDFQLINNKEVSSMHMAFRTLKNRYKDSINKKYGLIIDHHKSINTQIYFQTAFVIVEANEIRGIPYLLKEGDYACILSAGNRKQQKMIYNKLLEEIEKNNYIINGEAILLLLSHGDKKIFELQIPILKC